MAQLFHIPVDQELVRVAWEGEHLVIFIRVRRMTSTSCSDLSSLLAVKLPPRHPLPLSDTCYTASNWAGQPPCSPRDGIKLCGRSRTLSLGMRFWRWWPRFSILPLILYLSHFLILFPLIRGDPIISAPPQLNGLACIIRRQLFTSCSSQRSLTPYYLPLQRTRPNLGLRPHFAFGIRDFWCHERHSVRNNDGRQAEIRCISERLTRGCRPGSDPSPTTLP